MNTYIKRYCTICGKLNYVEYSSFDNCWNSVDYSCYHCKVSQETRINYYINYIKHYGLENLPSNVHTYESATINTNK